MKYSLSFSRRIESAHTLYHSEDCNVIHGHSWLIKWSYFLDTDKDNRNSFINKRGMAHDFSLFKIKVDKLISYLDNKLFVNKEDPILKKYSSKAKKDLVIFPSDPTCEIIALYIALFVYETAPCEVLKVGVNIKETPVNQCYLEIDNKAYLTDQHFDKKFIKSYAKFKSQFKSSR